MKNIAVLLAAGGGTRMGKKKPKTLLKLNGKPLVSYGVQSLLELREQKEIGGLEELVAVVGVRHKQVSRAISKAILKSHHDNIKVSFAIQQERLGTADAVRHALDVLEKNHTDLDSHTDLNSKCLLVLPADAPLITSNTLKELIHTHHQSNNPATLLTAKLADPKDLEGYGRIIRNSNGKLQKIVEHLDASPEELAVNEISTSIYCFRPKELRASLQQVQASKNTGGNSGGEYYLTDVVRLLIEAGYEVGAVATKNPDEILGINTPSQFKKVAEKVAENLSRRRELDTKI